MIARGYSSPALDEVWPGTPTYALGRDLLGAVVGSGRSRTPAIRMPAHDEAAFLLSRRIAAGTSSAAGSIRTTAWSASGIVVGDQDAVVLGRWRFSWHLAWSLDEHPDRRDEVDAAIRREAERVARERLGTGAERIAAWTPHSKDGASGSPRWAGRARRVEATEFEYHQQGDSCGRATRAARCGSASSSARVTATGSNSADSQLNANGETSTRPLLDQRSRRCRDGRLRLDEVWA